MKTMKKKPFNPLGQVSDQDKAHTPDKLRNDNAVWKAHDMPDASEANHAVPEDYERPQVDRDGAPRRR